MADPDGEATDVEEMVVHRKRRKRRYLRAMQSGVMGRVVNTVTQVLSLGLVAGYLGSDRMGMWFLVTAIIGFLGMTKFGLGFGLTTRLSNQVGAENREGEVRAISSTLAMVLVSSTVLFAVCLAVGLFVDWPGVFEVSTPLAISEARPTGIIVLCVTLLMIPISIGGSILSGHQRVDIVNITRAIGSVVGVVAVYVLIQLDVGLPILVLALMLPQLLADSSQFVIACIMSYVPFSWREIRVNEIREMFRLGGKFFILQVFVLVMLQSGIFIIAQLYGAENVPQYGFCMRMIMIIVSLASVMTMPLWPAFGEAYGRGDINWMRRVFWRMLHIMALVWIPMALLLAFIGKDLIFIWSSGNQDAVPSSLLLGSFLVLAFAQALGMVMSFLLNGVGQLWSQLVSGAILAVCFIPLSLLLCSYVGFAGVPLANAGLIFVVAIPMKLFHCLRVLKLEKGEGEREDNL